MGSYTQQEKFQNSQQFGNALNLFKKVAIINDYLKLLLKQFNLLL